MSQMPPPPPGQPAPMGAAPAAGGNKKYLDGFGPVAGGFDHIAYGDIEVTRSGLVVCQSSVVRAWKMR